MTKENHILDIFGPIEDQTQGIIKVIGVGGGGCNAVRNMYNEGVEGVTYAVCNTDSQSLAGSPVPVKMLLGETGLGAGANPELGKREAETNIDDIRRLLSDETRMVFVTAGMGGGTGTGAAPVIAGVAKEMGHADKSTQQLHQREVFAHKEDFHIDDGRLCRVILLYQRSYPTPYQWLLAYLV